MPEENVAEDLANTAAIADPIPEATASEAAAETGSSEAASDDSGDTDEA